MVTTKESSQLKEETYRIESSEEPRHHDTCTKVSNQIKKEKLFQKLIQCLKIFGP